MEDADAPHLIRIYRDPVLTHFMGAGPTEEPAELENIARHREEHYRKRGFGILAWVLKESGAIIGRGGYMASDLSGESFVELSYLLDVAHRKQGYASEAIEELLRWGRDELEFGRVVALIRSDNHDSISVAKRCGFQDMGVYVHPEHGEVGRYERDLATSTVDSFRRTCRILG